MKEKLFWVVAIVALVTGVWGIFSPFPDSIPSLQEAAEVTKLKFGAIGGMLAENYIPYVLYNGGFKTEKSFSVGSTTPKDIINIGGGTCNLTTGVAGGASGNNTFNASTTKMHYCAATGVRAGDQVFVTIPSAIAGQASSSVLAGPSLGLGLFSAGATATTSDIIGVALMNLTGAATGSYAQATTGVQYLIFR